MPYAVKRCTAPGPSDMTVVDDPDLLPPPRRSFYQRYEALILGGSAVIVAMVIWEALWEAGRISPLFFTGPSQVVERFVAEWTEGRLKQDKIGRASCRERVWVRVVR